MAYSDTVETYRSLRATIRNVAGEKAVRSVLVVDVDRKRPSEVAVNIARSIAAAGDRCVLVETNFRRAVDDSTGLSDLLQRPGGDLELTTDAGGLAVLGPGSSGNPDMLATPAFRSAIDHILESYDYAILTCEIYPDAADAIAIAPEVDAVIMVISAGVTRRDPAIRARDALERVGARILGIVMVERPRRWF